MQTCKQKRLFRDDQPPFASPHLTLRFTFPVLPLCVDQKRVCPWPALPDLPALLLTLTSIDWRTQMSRTTPRTRRTRATPPLVRTITTSTASRPRRRTSCDGVFSKRAPIRGGSTEGRWGAVRCASWCLNRHRICLLFLPQFT